LEWWIIQEKLRKPNLAIGGAIVFNDPTGLDTEFLQDLIIVTGLGQLIVPLSPETRVYLSSNGSPPLPPLVVLPLIEVRRGVSV
jgi:hypothetical protein